MAQLTKTGRNIRWYFNGQAVGMTRVKSLKPDKQQKLDAVKEAGNPDVAEYAKHVPETTVQLDYNVISVDQLANAMGLPAGVEVPDIPDAFDIVEKQIVPGTEGTTSEAAAGWTLYQGTMVEKESWDQEVDKLISVNISGKCRTPRRFPAYDAVNKPNGINGIQFDVFSGNGSTTSFVLTKKAKGPLKDGKYTIRVQTPQGGVPLNETVDFTVASTTSTTTVTFTTPPASATSNVQVVYAY